MNIVKAFNLHQISLAHKFFMLGILAGLMILVPTGLYFQQKNADLAFIQRELIALDSVDEFFRVMQLMQTHRGMAAGALAGEHMLAAQRLLLRDSVLTAIEVFDSVLRQKGAQPLSCRIWKDYANDGSHWNKRCLAISSTQRKAPDFIPNCWPSGWCSTKRC